MINTATVPCVIQVSVKENNLEAAFVGDWVMRAHIPASQAVYTQLDNASAIKCLVFSTVKLGQWDSLLMTELIRLINHCAKLHISVDTSTLPAGIQGLLSLVYAVPERTDTKHQNEQKQFLVSFGNLALRGAKDAQSIMLFMGELALSFLAWIRGKAHFRLQDFWLYIMQCGPAALPIITLISVLIGMILAFVGAVQLALFGAEIYIADMVGLGMSRDMGGLMAAIIMTGRSSSTFAAELGSMQVNSEIDALKTMGFQPMTFLVLPRMLALTLMLPMLCLYADFMGIAGGAMVTISFFDTPLVQYLDRTMAAVHLKDIAMGVVKCSVYGLLIAMAGCLRGMQCGRSASAVGETTTSAVVTGIVFIVIADAIMTMLSNRLGI
ncbi:ABC transporter permease [Methylomonas sp. AM2-LC]|uniref:MlaE family ABC transporter permease n=1 Tax=Methylomonas sp. AM2-LC TaxID=3153301 RepID=UPI003266AC37